MAGTSTNLFLLQFTFYLDRKLTNVFGHVLLALDAIDYEHFLTLADDFF